MNVAEATTALVAIKPVQHGHTQVRRELRQFRRPVRDQAGRDHNQHGTIQPSRRMLDGDVGDGLRGLAQPHLVGEKAV